MKYLFLIAALLLGGCPLPDQHSGHIWIHDPVRVPVSDPNQDPDYVEALHVEVQFDRPMTMSVERDGTKVEASSIKPGIFDDIIKFFFLRPR